MNNKILTVLAIVMAAFPFVAVVVELANKESMTTVLVFLAIAGILAITVTAAFLTTKQRRS